MKYIYNIWEWSYLKSNNCKYLIWEIEVNTTVYVLDDRMNKLCKKLVVSN